MSEPIPALPDPKTDPTIDLWPTAARLLGVGRNAIYAAAAAGEVPTIRIGHRFRVPTAALLRQLGLEDESDV